MAVPPYATAADQAAAQQFFRDRSDAQKTWAWLLGALDLGGCKLVSTSSRVAVLGLTRFLWIHDAHRDGSITIGFLGPTAIDSPRVRGARSGARWSNHVKMTMHDVEALTWVRAAAAFELDTLR